MVLSPPIIGRLLTKRPRMPWVRWLSRHLGLRTPALIAVACLSLLGSIVTFSNPPAALAAALYFVLGGALVTIARRPRPSGYTPAALASFPELWNRSAVVVRNLDGVITHWSPGCERLFGISAAAALGQRAPALLGTRFPPGGLRTAQTALLRDGEWRGILRHRCDGKEALVVAVHWVAQRDLASGTPVGVVELHTDATALTQAEAALRAGEARLLLAQELAGVSTWEWDVEADAFSWTPKQYGLLDPAPSAATPGTIESLLAVVHPADREGILAAGRQALETGEYCCEFRVLVPARDGGQDQRWLIGRGRRLPGPAGRRGPILGVHVDISARKETEERQALLMREVDHRAKNALAVVQAVLRLTRAETPEAFGRAISGRVAALARAQTLLTESRWVGADLGALVQGELAPFLGEGGATRVSIGGPPLIVTPMAAQPLSMALHELATNAAKYGALSAPGGTLVLSWVIDRPADRLRFNWTEHGGPAIAAPPCRLGFGSRMLRATVEDQLGGSLAMRWEAGGLVCDIAVPIGRSVTRPPAPKETQQKRPAGPEAVGFAWPSS